MLKSCYNIRKRTAIEQDSETGYYYQQSRYYDPSVCRFINADAPEIMSMTKNMTAGINMYAYCNNNPVNLSDPSGMSWVSMILNILSMILSVASLFNGLLWFKIVLGVVVAVASVIATMNDYNNQMAKINRKYSKGKISYTKYQQKVRDANFWKWLGFISAGITFVCSLLSLPFKWLATKVIVQLVNALGFARGMVIGKFTLINDLVDVLNHKPKYGKYA